MINGLENFDWTTLWSWVSVVNLIDVLIVSFFIYQIMRISRGSRSNELLKGIFVIVSIKILSSFFNLLTTEYIVDFIIQWSAIALIVIFQPELRRGLQHIGRGSLFSIRKQSDPLEDTVEDIAEAVQYMSRRHIGALISIEKESPLTSYIKTGIPIDAKISSEFIINAFIPNTPLHDGAMIINDFRIASAASYLPLSESAAIPKKYGTRHRAAIGLSEETDAITVVVSEETGAISIAHRSNLIPEMTVEEMANYLFEELKVDDDEQNKSKVHIYLEEVVEMIRKAVTNK